ncbi:hypothetical protein PHO31112_02771 [Pandoraea horticolens]|uniref:DUF1330 domain-containing protein n=1 Tax=Pandoraea horticolens TaxID=2508298 RepID=A0A5E4VNA7_9BURK|nr:DUF1330 domain-containing protein [Pandoraea horticolens]VVE13897.1 hypothetical protein PHO31112_02771 [Pandoraea horticolens]
MPAYLIARVMVANPDVYADYTALTPSIVKAYGGQFLSRGAPPITLEGPEEDRRVVVVEFPDMASARAFYDSEAYQSAKAIRATASEAEFVIVAGASA